MSLVATPPRSTPISVRRGDKGWLVFAAQKSVGIAADGDFGPITEATVRAEQKKVGLTIDGVVGPMTQEIFAGWAIIAGGDAASLPTGLLRGIVESESGLMLAAVGWSVAGGVDCGLVQRRVYGAPYSIIKLKEAFDPLLSTRATATTLASLARSFTNMNARCKFSKWELAALSHNWPSAAQRFFRDGGLGADGERVATWAPASMGRVTWNQWADFYVGRVTRYMV